MKEFILKKYDRFTITGRGLVFTVHRDENDVEDISNGDKVILKDTKEEFEVTAIECSKNNFGFIGKNIGLLVKPIKKLICNYQVYLKNWYQEIPNEIQEEVMYECEYIEDAWEFLKSKAEKYINEYPIEEMGIRIKK